MKFVSPLAACGLLVFLVLPGVAQKQGQQADSRVPRYGSGSSTETDVPSVDDAVPDGLSADDWSGIRAAYEAHRHAARPVEGGYRAHNPGQQWQTCFDGRGFTTQPDAGAWTWGLELLRYGLGDQQRAVAHPARVSAEDGRVAYDWDATLTEWYENDARGLEHGYTVRQRPIYPGDAVNHESEQDAPLSFTLAVRGELLPEVAADGRGVRFVDPNGTLVLTYSGLTAFDADGNTLPARLEPARMDSGLAGLLLTVDERGARYPLTIDPLVQRAYLKASNTGNNDGFGVSVSMSGATVVVGANGERSNATGVNGDESNNSASNSGAAYVFVRSNGMWSQQAYLKASNTNGDDNFGASVSVASDTLVVGAWGEASSATGVNGNQVNNTSFQSGAAYVFVRSGTNWSQEAYLKASNTDSGDLFGTSVSMSGDTIVVGATGESSDATGVNGDQTNNLAITAGAAYVFVRSGTTWSQEAYLKASNTGANDNFSFPLSVSGDTIVVGATGEGSNATGVNGNQSDNSASLSGAAYVFVRDGTIWSQEAYLKASNTDNGDLFGQATSVSGNTIVIGAGREESNATGVNGDQSDNSLSFAGAAYVFVRNGTTWSQEAYLKASNTDSFDQFGVSASVSGDTVAVGATGEASNAIGVDGDQSDNSAGSSGAAYVFTRDGTTWSQEGYLKASNTNALDFFGSWVAVSGNKVVVGARLEDSSATGVDGNQNDNGAAQSGAAYLFAIPSTGRTKILRFTGVVGSGGTITDPDLGGNAGLSTDGSTPGLGLFQAVPGDPLSLRATYERGGALAVLRIGTHRLHDGERALVHPPLWKRTFVLDGVPGSPAGGSLEIRLDRLPHALLDQPLFVQLVILDPEGGRGALLSPVVELPPPFAGAWGVVGR